MRAGDGFSVGDRSAHHRLHHHRQQQQQHLSEPLSMGHVNTMKLLTSSACLPLDFLLQSRFFKFFSFYIGMSGVARRIYAISDCHSVFSQ